MEILSVIQDRKFFRAARELTLPDGSTMLAQFVFPRDTLEWRSAEYQIDPRETDLLMDVVLYESIMPAAEIPILYTAETIDEARDTYVGQVLDFKHQIRPMARSWKSPGQRSSLMKQIGLDPIWLGAITEDALLPIREGALLDPEVITEKARTVREARASMQRARDRAPAAIDRATAMKTARVSRKMSAPMIDGEANGSHH